MPCGQKSKAGRTKRSGRRSRHEGKHCRQYCARRGYRRPRYVRFAGRPSGYYCSRQPAAAVIGGSCGYPRFRDRALCISGISLCIPMRAHMQSAVLPSTVAPKRRCPRPFCHSQPRNADPDRCFGRSAHLHADQRRPRSCSRGKHSRPARRSNVKQGMLGRCCMIYERSKAGEKELSGLFTFSWGICRSTEDAASIHRELAHHLVLDELLYQFTLRSADPLELDPHASPAVGT